MIWMFIALLVVLVIVFLVRMADIERCDLPDEPWRDWDGESPSEDDWC